MSAVGDFSGTGTPGRPWFARERDGDRAEGRSLAAILAGVGPMNQARVAKIVDGIALALQAAHRQGIAHGRLTPENVLVLPRAAGDAPDEVRTKLIGFAAPGHAAPGDDLVALGALAYEMLAGGAPSDGRAPGARAPRPIRVHAPDVDLLVDEVVRRALSPDPELRWADVYTFSTRLREAAEGLGLDEDPTRLAPIPLTVSRPAGTPTPVEIDVELPVIASVDVDLSTPAPRPGVSFSYSFSGGPTMNQSHHQPPRGPAHGGHYPIRPTPTFSFTDGPEPGPLWTPADRPRRRRRGGGMPLLTLMVIAGLGGYFAVRYHAWPELGPITEKAKELLGSLRTLAPSAKLDPPPAATPAPSAPAAAGATQPAATAPAPALHPEVVPIVAPTATPPKPAPLSPPRAHVSRSHKRKPLKPLSAEAAAEEALLAAPSR
jgi:hypothetical protein